MPLTFYNTMTRRDEEFREITKGVVTLYTCGPTVYNYPHIGNLRTFLFEDLLHRWLVYRGYDVRHVMNLTDVDDKTIKNSIKQNMTLDDYTAIYKKAFFDDLYALHVKPANWYPEATTHIPEMLDIIAKLFEKGLAYEAPDGVYFKVSAFRGYGALANLEHNELKAGASGRLSDEYEKEDMADFALWKKWTPGDGDVKWPSPWGEGRPGWHLECSAMSMKYLGETIDIHAGGVDLVFPHHTNEIAQSEGVTGKTFVNTWLHAAHLVVDGEKMSKSKGNFYTLRDLTSKGTSPRAVRYALLSAHYRKQLNFTQDLVRQAESSLKRLDEFVFFLQSINKAGQPDSGLKAALDKSHTGFENALDHDLNISEAMASVFELISAYYEGRDRLDKVLAADTLDYLRKIDAVLGFVLEEKAEGLCPEEEALLKERNEAKAARDFTRADAARARLLALGVEVRDTKDGVVWKRI